MAGEKLLQAQAVQRFEIRSRNLKGKLVRLPRVSGPLRELKMTAILCTPEEGAAARALADAKRMIDGLNLKK